MRLFIAICIAHFAEHFAQIIQLYVLDWSRPDCLGVLGLWQPWLIRSEWLHYLYALFMLIGLYLLNCALPISAEMVTREGIVVIAESEELNQCNLGQLKN
jgi:hypothetical protein